MSLRRAVWLLSAALAGYSIIILLPLGGGILETVQVEHSESVLVESRQCRDAFKLMANFRFCTSINIKKSIVIFLDRPLC